MGQRQADRTPGRNSGPDIRGTALSGRRTRSSHRDHHLREHRPTRTHDPETRTCWAQDTGKPAQPQLAPGWEHILLTDECRWPRMLHQDARRVISPGKRPHKSRLQFGPCARTGAWAHQRTFGLNLGSSQLHFVAHHCAICARPAADRLDHANSRKPTPRRTPDRFS